MWGCWKKFSGSRSLFQPEKGPYESWPVLTHIFGQPTFGQLLSTAQYSQKKKGKWGWVGASTKPCCMYFLPVLKHMGCTAFLANKVCWKFYLRSQPEAGQRSARSQPEVFQNSTSVQPKQRSFFFCLWRKVLFEVKD